MVFVVHRDGHRVKGAGAWSRCIGTVHTCARAWCIEVGHSVSSCAPMLLPPLFMWEMVRLRMLQGCMLILVCAGGE